MNKKILSLTLAVLLICTMALPAFATSNYITNQYQDASYEVSETCTYHRVTSSLFSDSSYTLQTMVDVYGWDVEIDGDTVDIIDADATTFTRFKSTTAVLASSLSYFDAVAIIDHVVYTNYVNGDYVHSNILYPSAS